MKQFHFVWCVFRLISGLTGGENSFDTHFGTEVNVLAWMLRNIKLFRLNALPMFENALQMLWNDFEMIFNEFSISLGNIANVLKCIENVL